MASKETGIQFLARLGSRPSLTGVEPVLFGSEGPQMKDVIEIYGGEGTGKTELLMHLICRSILPESWNNIPLYGHEAGVIFIDTDLKFSILRLVNIMEEYVTSMQKKSLEKPSASSTDLEKFISECLTKLHIIQCSNSSQLLVTLHNIENLILNESSTSVIMIDSISAFYWIDRYSGGDSVLAQEANMKNITEILHKLVDMYSLTLFVTKSSMFKKKIQTDSKDIIKVPAEEFQTQDLEMLHAEFMCKVWQRFVTHRLILVKNVYNDTQSDSFIVGGDCVQGNCKFTVTEAGISFRL